MTSIAFIMGVVPLVFSTGAGFEIRQAMGIAVFAGMLGVTLFGLFLTPVFYDRDRPARGRVTAPARASADRRRGSGGRTLIMKRRTLTSWRSCSRLTLAACAVRPAVPAAGGRTGSA